LEISWNLRSDTRVDPFGEIENCQSGQHVKILRKRKYAIRMLAYNLFLLYKMDFAKETEYRQQIKTFRLKYIFSDREDYPNGQKCGDETFREISLSRDA
jgi:hypothetical protein